MCEQSSQLRTISTAVQILGCTCLCGVCAVCTLVDVESTVGRGQVRRLVIVLDMAWACAMQGKRRWALPWLRKIWKVQKIKSPLLSTPSMGCLHYTHQWGAKTVRGDRWIGFSDWQVSKRKFTFTGHPWCKRKTWLLGGILTKSESGSVLTVECKSWPPTDKD